VAIDPQGFKVLDGGWTEQVVADARDHENFRPTEPAATA